MRDGFGPNAGFSAFVAENADGVLGMVTYSRRIITGWNTPTVLVQDLFVEPAYRSRGVARALLGCVAALARELGSPIVELTVRSDNPARIFYQRNGFRPVPECLTYVLAGPALSALADQNCADQESEADALAG